jgi:hypothetical protein
MTRSVCYSTAGTVQAMYSDVAHTTAILWDPNTTNPAKVRRLDLAGSAIGGVADLSGPCAGGTLWLDKMNFDGKRVGGGKTEAFGFDSIFPNMSGQDYSIQTSFAAGNMTASWSYVSNDVIGPNGVDGVAVFSSDTFEGEASMGGDGVNCKGLTDPALNAGFSHKMDVVGTGTTASFAASSANEKVIVCPFKNNYMGQARYYLNGGQSNFHGNGGGGGGGGPATQIGVRGPLVANVSGGCSEVEVSLLDAGGNQAEMAASDVVVDLAGTGGTTGALNFRNNSCSGTAGITQVTINSGTNSYRIGVEASGSPLPDTLYIVASSSSPLLPAENSGAGSLFTIAGSSEVTRLNIMGTAGTSLDFLKVNQCTAARTQYTNYSGNANINGSPAINLSGMGVFIYSDEGCTSAATSVTAITSISYSPYFWIKATQSGWVNINSEVTSYAPTSGASYGLTGMMGLRAGAAGEPVALSFFFPGGPPSLSGTCYEAQVRVIDSDSNLVNAPAGGLPAINLNLNGIGDFYSENTCTTLLTPTETSIANGTSTSPSFYYKAPTSGPVTLKAAWGSSSNSFWGSSPQFSLP